MNPQRASGLAVERSQLKTADSINKSTSIENSTTNGHPKRTSSKPDGPTRLSAGEGPILGSQWKKIPQPVQKKYVDPVPGPGTYSPKENPNYRNQYRIPKQDHLSFGSSQGRFGSDVKNETIEYNNSLKKEPGPGAYNSVYFDIGNPKKMVKKVAPKQTISLKQYMKQKGQAEFDDAGPGPGAYDLSGSMVKKTYNVTENVNYQDYILAQD